MNNDEIKRRTLELYKQLPPDEEGRKARTDIRDEVITLNYTFFGYIASHTYVNNPYIDYYDKFQSALTHFCEIWYYYQWEGHYRTDLSFSVFFKPRISEMIDRELTVVKYSLRRTLTMKVGDQLGKHWSKVTYDDLSNPEVTLSTEDMNSLKAIFGSLYIADIDDHSTYIDGTYSIDSITNLEKQLISDEYDSVQDLLIHEMAEEERQLTDKDLKKMSDMYDIPLSILQQNLRPAMESLYYSLKKSQIENGLI